MSQTKSKSTAREMAEEVWAASSKRERVQTVVWFVLIAVCAVGAVALIVAAIVGAVIA